MSKMAPGEASAFRRAATAGADRIDDPSIPRSGGVAATVFRADRLWYPCLDRETVAAMILEARRARSIAFSDIVLGNPSWDIMLDLYVSTQTSQRVSISDVCIGAGVPVSTALRHVNRLVEHGYVVRAPDPTDRRRTFVDITNKLSAALETWLDRYAGAAQWHQ